MALISYALTKSLPEKFSYLIQKVAPALANFIIDVGGGESTLVEPTDNPPD